MKYKFFGNTLQLVKYVLTQTYKVDDEERTREFYAVSDAERDSILTIYPDAEVETVDNDGYEFLDGTTWTQTQIANGELAAAIEDGELPMSQEEINAMLMLEIAALKAGGTDE